jgi:osmotically inducible protein OsmC
MSINPAKGRIEGGRQGRATAERGTPDLLLTPPAALGGPDEPGEGTNPEELFALGYGACFLSTLQFVARSRKISAKAFTMDSVVDRHQVDDGFELSVGLDANMPGIDAETGAELMHQAHRDCVYSKAVRGNLDVTLSVNGQPV